jgi:alkanesulfonate monooxygenase SsuD/methylene tetrahydromethanopterin reductase-like flavin-dependent oxidoreductase (luciferase family)
LNVPIWILGSSLFGAQLAAELGLPFAFASHFAPAQMMQAIEFYRSRFRPSVLDIRGQTISTTASLIFLVSEQMKDGIKFVCTKDFSDSRFN